MCFTRAGTQVRSNHYVRQRKQWRVGDGFTFKNIQRSTSDEPITQGFEEVMFRHDAASRHVDHSQRRLGLHEQITIDEPECFFVLREVHRKKVARGYELIERQHIDVHLAATLD